jgi:hypothetical protein
MRAERGFKGDVAAGLEGLRDCEGVRRLGAVLGRQGVYSPRRIRMSSWAFRARLTSP